MPRGIAAKCLAVLRDALWDCGMPCGNTGYLTLMRVVVDRRNQPARHPLWRL